MIDPVSAVGGSAVSGAVIGLLSNAASAYFRNKLELERIRWQGRFEQNEQLKAYQTDFKVDGRGRAITPPFYLPVLLLTCTYCFAVCICFLCGDIPVASQGFGAEPTETSLAWGLFVRSSTNNEVYLLTLAGLGTYFLSPIAFILTAVLSGIVPRKG